MDQEVTAIVVKHNIVIEPVDWSDHERVITVEAVLGTPNGIEIGSVETDVFEFAPNLALALVKAYWINRRLAKGTLVPELYL